jgi:hypothetical protein
MKEGNYLFGDRNNSSIDCNNSSRTSKPPWNHRGKRTSDKLNSHDTLVDVDDSWKQLDCEDCYFGRAQWHAAGRTFSLNIGIFPFLRWKSYFTSNMSDIQIMVRHMQEAGNKRNSVNLYWSMNSSSFTSTSERSNNGRISSPISPSSSMEKETNNITIKSQELLSLHVNGIGYNHGSGSFASMVAKKKDLLKRLSLWIDDS